jgi:hypothetical protein
MLALSIDPQSHDGLRQPRNLEQRARDLLEQHSHFRGRASVFQYECDRDVLTVRGIVPTFYLKQLLQAALKGLEDVARIDNQVAVACHMNLGKLELQPWEHSH